MFKFFQKKGEGLEKARQLNLITELEFLKLRSERAEADFQAHLKKNERHKRRKK